MVIVEESTNFPTVLGAKNITSTKSWAPGAIIGTLPSVVRERQGLLPQLFRQLPPRGTGLIRGTAGSRRGGIPRTAIERLTRHKAIYGQDLSIQAEEAQLQMNAQYNAQMTKYPIIPLLDRPHPVLDAIKAQAPVIPRTKLIGVFGLLDPSPETAKNIPLPWGPRTWPPEAEIGGLPSVIKTGVGASGPTRTMHPEISIVV